MIYGPQWLVAPTLPLSMTCSQTRFRLREKMLDFELLAYFFHSCTTHETFVNSLQLWRKLLMILNGLDLAFRLSYSQLHHPSSSEVKAMETYRWPINNHHLCIYSCLRTSYWIHDYTTWSLVLQIDFSYYANTDLLTAFSCDRQVSHRFFPHHLTLHATTFIRNDNGSSLPKPEITTKVFSWACSQPVSDLRAPLDPLVV